MSEGHINEIYSACVLFARGAGCGDESRPQAMNQVNLKHTAKPNPTYTKHRPDLRSRRQQPFCWHWVEIK